MRDSPRLVVVSPVRNEGKNLSRTIKSVTEQRLKPQRWIIVDDGSSDETARIAQEAADAFDWIELLRRPDRGARKSGAGVMEAFYDGYRQVKDLDWEILAKLDGDLEFTDDFFHLIAEAFGSDPKLGIAGGDIYHYNGSEAVIESRDDPAFHVRGATKFYRRECWTAMGGLVEATGWDTLDEVKAVMLGWKTYRIPKARVLHLRPTGGADGGWKNAFKNGRGSYISGYHPLYMLSKCVKRIAHRPVLVQSLGLCAGFFSSYFTNVQRVADSELIRYLRKQQIRRLFGLSSIWR